MPPQKPVLHISEITPMRITFKWDSEDNVEIDHFEIYKNGEFFKNTKSSEYTDTVVTAGDEYSYYVVAIDTSGNVSEASDTKKISAKNDEEKPQIGIAAQTLTETSKSLKIVCTDDVMLSELNAEIKVPSSEEWSSVKTQTLSQKSQFVNLDLSDYLTDSGEYDIRISVSDAAGNTETVESKFTYAKNQMSEFEVTAVADGCSVRLDWTSASDSSDVYYEIRRKDADGVEKYIATTRASELTYTDSGLYPLAEYSYFIIAHDENMYTVNSNTADITSGKDTIAPVASAGRDIVTIEGCIVGFDGSRSLDNFGVKEYLWDFGDGTTGTGKISEHTYSAAGTYIVTLTVTDESGNSDTDTLTATVYDKNHCMVRIKVTDDSGKSLPSAVASCTLPDIEETMFYSNSDGEISLVATKGTYDFYFFANDCLPLKKSITLEADSSGNASQTITLTKSELVTADFVVKPLDIEEIKEHGIDVTAPENQYVCKVEMTVDNIDTGELEKFEVIVNQEGELIQIEKNGGFKVIDNVETKKETEKPQGTVTTTTSTSTLQSGINRKEESESQPAFTAKPQPISLTTMVSMSVTEYSWLKDFYEVSITFTNHSEKGFDIIDPKAILNIGDGLEFAGDNLANPEERIFDTIEGGTAQTVTWIIKGKKSGRHNISVNFEGILSPFGIPIKAYFPNDTPIVVTGGEALKLKINAGLTEADITLTNISDKNIYNAAVDMSSYGEFTDAQKIFVKYPSGLIEIIEWSDSGHTKTKRTIYYPVGCASDTDVFELRTLEPNECIVGTMWYQQNAVEQS